MPEYNLLNSYPKAKRNIQARSKGKNEEIIKAAKEFGKMYFDGPREYGYGGYRYDGSSMLGEFPISFKKG